MGRLANYSNPGSFWIFLENKCGMKKWCIGENNPNEILSDLCTFRMHFQRAFLFMECARTTKETLSDVIAR